MLIDLSSQIKELNTVTWKFLKEYLQMLRKSFVSLSEEQKHFFNLYERYYDVILNLTEEELEYLSYSSVCSFEISPTSLCSCIDKLPETDVKPFLNPAAFSQVITSNHDSMIRGYFIYYMNKVQEIYRQISSFFSNKGAITGEINDMQENFSSFILGKSGSRFVELMSSNPNLDFVSHLDRFELKISPRFELSVIKTLRKVDESKRENCLKNNVSMMMLLDVFENKI